MKNLENPSNDSFQLASSDFKQLNLLLFLPREKWIPDEKVEFCFNCNKKFFFWFRRKHHCRKCGFIFCYSCSSSFVNIEEIGINYDEKLVRLCDYCFQGCQNYLSLIRKEVTNVKKSIQGENSDIIEEQEEENLSENINFAGEVGLECDLHIRIKQEALTKIEKMIEHFLKKLNFYEAYFEPLSKIVVEALNFTKIDYINGRDELDINHYIKIKKIISNDVQKIQFIKGLVFRKNISDRRMQSNFKEPRILIVSPSIDVFASQNESESDLIGLENYIQKENKTIKKVVENIISLQPNIIFVEKTVNRLAFDYLKIKNITIIVKLKPLLIRRLARFTKARILKNLKNISKIADRNKIIGACQNFYSQKTYFESIHQKPETQIIKEAKEGAIEERTSFSTSFNEETYIFMDKPDAVMGNTSTIILRGDDLKSLKTLKNYLKLIILLARHFLLEKELIYVDALFAEDHKVDENQRNEGDFSKFLEEKISLAKFVKKEFINYSKIKLVKSILDNHIDIKENQSAMQELKEKFDSNQMNNILGFLAESCGSPSVKNIYHYSQDDISLGTFILKKVKNLFTKCTNCKRPRYHHIDLYCKNDIYVRITVDLTGFSKSLAIFENGNYMFLEDKHSHSLESSTRLSYEELRQKTQLVNNIMTEEGILSPTKTASFNQTYTIKTYIQCNDCSLKLTKEKQLEKEYLEYSFTRFLSHFFESKMTKQANDKFLKTEFTCSHTSKKRVFQYGEYLVTFTAGQYNCYSFGLVSSKTILNQMDKKLEQIINEKRLIYLNKFKHLTNILIQTLKVLINESQEDVIIEYNLILANLLQNLLRKSQLFTLTIETILGSVQKDKTYLDLEFQKFSLSKQLTKLIDSLIEINSRKTEKGDDSLLNEPNMLELMESRISKRIYFSTSILTKKMYTISNFKKSEKDNEERRSFSPDQYDQRLSFNERKRSSSNSHLNVANIKSEIRRTVIKKEEFKKIEKALLKKSIFKITQEQKNDSYEESSSEKEYYLDQSKKLGNESCFEDDDNGEDFENIINNLSRASSKSHFNYEEEFRDLFDLNEGQTVQFLQQLNEKIDIPGQQKFKYVPIIASEPITAVAHALNSWEYFSQIYQKFGFDKYEEENFTLKCSKQYKALVFPLTKKILKLSKSRKPSHFVFKTQLVKPFFSNFSETKKQDKLEKNDKNEKPDKHKKSHINVKVKVYFAEQFEAFRMENRRLLTSFILSIGSSSQWQENSGGKSKASFIKSHDELYVFKEIEKKEFFMFFNYAEYYFDYMHKISQRRKPSVLTKIFGLFEIRFNNTKYFYIAMENLFLGLNSSQLQIYDLKGSETNRYLEKKQIVGQTLLDTNFRIDRNGESIALRPKNKKFCEQAFENDVRFLQKHNLIDYSLLLIIDVNKLEIRMGIIDYLREYTWDKKVENYAKTITKGGAVPTIICPEEYAKRFVMAMNTFFMEMPFEE